MAQLVFPEMHPKAMLLLGGRSSTSRPAAAPARGCLCAPAGTGQGRAGGCQAVTHLRERQQQAGDLPALPCPFSGLLGSPLSEPARPFPALIP